MGKKKVDYDFRNVSPVWQVCFLDECPVKDKCLRQLVAKHLPEDRDFGVAVFPTMKIGETGCRLFATSEPKLMAWGFDKLFYDVKSRDAAQLRSTMKKYLGGHSNFYRYNSGELLLIPEQQEWIINLFRKYGYAGELTFDHFAYVFDYS